MDRLFRSGATAHGETLQDGTPKGSPRTVDGPITEDVWARHLAGEIRAGLVPVDESGMSWCGAVDVDKHDGSGVDLAGVVDTLRKLGFPGTVVKTRRGGAHVWFFTSEPVDTRLLIRLLEIVARSLRRFGDPVEVFPKQAVLTLGNKGSWIHLPYCGGDNTTTYAVELTSDGIQPMTLAEFLAYAEARRIAANDIQHLLNLPPTSGDVDYSKAPPCLEILAQRGVTEGGRSNALLQFGIFFQRAGLPVEAELAKVNATVFAKPLPKSAVRDVANRIERNSYGYMCSQPPQCDVCDKAECLRREFGVGAKAFAFDAEMFRGLTKVDFEQAPVYLLKVKTRVVELDAASLLSWKAVREAVVMATNELLPVLKDQQWEQLLRPMLAEMKVQKAPAGSSPTAMIRDLIERFLAPVQEKVRTGHRHQHSDVLLGMPVILEDHHGLRIAFRPEDLLAQARRRKINLEPEAAWMVASRMGFEDDTVLAGGRTVEVWWKTTEATPAPKFTPAVGQEEF